MRVVRDGGATAALRAEGGAMNSVSDARPYEELEAVVDALAGLEPCWHGLWPHQGKCRECARRGNGGTVTLTAGNGGATAGTGGRVCITGGIAH